jgi:hypothetical protein
MGALQIAFAILLAGCAKRATEEQCREAWTHVFEVQIDEMDAAKNMDELIKVGKFSPDVMADARAEAIAHEADTKQWLKSQIPSMLAPPLIKGCQRRLNRHDINCTMAASTSVQLVKKCHWRVVQGPRGLGLGLE